MMVYTKLFNFLLCMDGMKTYIGVHSGGGKYETLFYF